jgi:hypothetical protein
VSTLINVGGFYISILILENRGGRSTVIARSSKETR